MTYSAPWSRLLVGVSSVASLILVAVSWINWRFIGDPAWLGPTLAALTSLIMIVCLLFMIRGYRLDGAHLYVRRLLWETAVDLRGLESVVLDPESMKGAIKLFGNGGLFSFSGLFRSRKLGRFRALMTHHGNAVVLRFSGKTLVVSPGDPHLFVADVLQRNPHLQSREVEKGR